MKIAHLSDLHISPLSRPENSDITRRLLNYALEEGVEHIVVTGDLTDLARPDDFWEARKIFNDYGLLNPSKLTVIIGNHDIFGGVHLARDLIKYPTQCDAVNYNRKVHEFKSYFLETFENIYVADSAVIFPFIKPVGDLMFIGVNSIAQYSKLRNLFAAKGRIYKSQLTDLETLLKKYGHDAKKRILLIHHHFNKQADTQFSSRQPMLKRIELHANRLQYKRKLYRLMRKHNIDLTLHGHEHLSHQYNQRGFHFMNSGGCVDKIKPRQLIVNFIEYRGDKLITEIRTINEDKRANRHKILTDTLILND
ncbi:metallophosphoesterase [candidate division KSB1 bacterium]|nr:metallophosphoesterase [candidate division KSB1 bacterium]